jgi:hypothetical protein
MSTTWQSTTRFVDAICGVPNMHALGGDTTPRARELRHLRPTFITHNR